MDMAADADRLDQGMRLGGRQREALELLAAAPDGIETASLADRDIE